MSRLLRWRFNDYRFSLKTYHNAGMNITNSKLAASRGGSLMISNFNELGLTDKYRGNL